MFSITSSGLRLIGIDDDQAAIFEIVFGSGHAMENTPENLERLESAGFNLRALADLMAPDADKEQSTIAILKGL